MVHGYTQVSSGLLWITRQDGFSRNPSFQQRENDFRAGLSGPKKETADHHWNDSHEVRIGCHLSGYPPWYYCGCDEGCDAAISWSMLPFYYRLGQNSIPIHTAQGCHQVVNSVLKTILSLRPAQVKLRRRALTRGSGVGVGVARPRPTLT